MKLKTGNRGNLNDLPAHTDERTARRCRRRDNAPQTGRLMNSNNFVLVLLEAGRAQDTPWVSCPLSLLPSHPRRSCSSPVAEKPPNYTEERLHHTKADSLEKWHPGCSLNTCKSGGKDWADEASDHQTREKAPVVPVAEPFWEDRRSRLNPASPVLTQLQAHIGAPSTNPSDHRWSHWKLASSHSSPVMSGYYGVRRSFLSDSDFHNTKQFSSDVCTSGPAAKPFACEAPAGQSHPGLLDSYFPDPHGDHRPPGLTPSTSSLLSASPLPPLLPPPFPGDPTTHFVLRDSWEQTAPDGLSQADPVPTDTLQTLPPNTGCLSQLESGSTAPHRSSSWGGPLAGAQSYSLHALEDLYHVSGYPTPPPYPFTPFMTMSNDLPHKVVPLSPGEGADTAGLQDPSSWTKEDGSMAWGSYECRRAY
uniref:Uncharacterized protein C11orf53 homolog n=1 Tax=Callorhinus ursinus TaxID=34884 RepID=A0A3Q7R405_CALUR|nr:uncharacterized protein C11orf53 homolog [Callorhinus ursinus]